MPETVTIPLDVLLADVLPADVLPADVLPADVLPADVLLADDVHNRTLVATVEIFASGIISGR